MYDKRGTHQSGVRPPRLARFYLEISGERGPARPGTQLCAAALSASSFVMPAQAGIQGLRAQMLNALDPCLRRDDGREGRDDGREGRDDGREGRDDKGEWQG